MQVENIEREHMRKPWTYNTIIFPCLNEAYEEGELDMYQKTVQIWSMLFVQRLAFTTETDLSNQQLIVLFAEKLSS